MKHRLTLTEALKWICISTLLISGSAAVGWFSYYYFMDHRKNSEVYNIVAVIQSTPHEKQLDHQYLSEILGLALDNPKNLYTFNAKKATSTLRSLPMVKMADVKKIPPGTLKINYTLCQPIGIILDYSNTAIDGGGCLFPYHPFYDEMDLPRIYLGMKPLHSGNVWGTQIQGDTLTLAFEIAYFLKEQILSEFIELTSIDVSNAYDENYGKKEIVVTFNFFDEGEWRPLHLRIGTNAYETTLKNFISLYRHVIPNRKVTIADMRIPNIAFIGCD